MIVVDASILANLVADDDMDGDRARARVRDEELAAPALADLEVLSVLRRAVRAGRLTERRAAMSVADLAALPIEWVPHRALVTRVWELRDNVTAYDAAYVALAEVLGATLVTADAALSRAAGPRCPIEVLC